MPLRQAGAAGSRASDSAELRVARRLLYPRSMVEGVGDCEFRYFVSLHRDIHHGMAAFIQAMSHAMAVIVVPNVTGAGEAPRAAPCLMITSLISDAPQIREPTRISDVQRRTAIAISVRDQLVRMGQPEAAERFFDQALRVITHGAKVAI